MAQQAPLTLGDDSTSRRWFSDLNKYARRAKLRQSRLNTIRLLASRVYPNGEAYAEHDLAWNDPPDLELLFERRNIYRGIRLAADRARERIASEAQMDADTLNRCLESLANLERTATQHLMAMEIHLGEARKLELKHMEMLGKMLAEGAKLMQNERKNLKDNDVPDVRELARVSRGLKDLPEDRFDADISDA
jgi:hypothetical protein